MEIKRLMLRFVRAFGHLGTAVQQLLIQKQHSEDEKYHFIHVGFNVDSDLWTGMREQLLANDGCLVGPLQGKLKTKWTWVSRKGETFSSVDVRYIGDISAQDRCVDTCTEEEKDKVEPVRGGGTARRQQHHHQQRAVAAERENRFSHACTDMDKICTIAAVTGRSARMYVAHLFPDYGDLAAVRARLAGARVVDVACGLNPFLRRAFLARVAGAARACVGVDVVHFGKRAPAPGVQYLRHNILRRHHRHAPPALQGGPEPTVVLMHNFFYLWEEDPAKLRRGLRALRRWLPRRRRGSEIRIFPCYFGQYGAFSSGLRRWIDRYFHVRVLRPRLMAETVPVLRGRRVTWVPWRDNVEEVRANRRLRARTLVLRRRER